MIHLIVKLKQWHICLMGLFVRNMEKKIFQYHLVHYEILLMEQMVLVLDMK